MFAVPRSSDDYSWLRSASARLLDEGKRVIWAVDAAYFANLNQQRAPEGVLVYPGFDLPEDLDKIAPSRNATLHNVDAPCPYADRVEHLWDAFGLGSDDVFVVPHGRLADLEALWNVYAVANLEAAPTTLIHLSELVTAESGAATSHAELMERLRWIAYRLKVLDLTNKKVLVWPGSQVIATVLEQVELPATEAFPVKDNPVSRGPMLAVVTVDEDEQALAETLSKACAGQVTDVTSFETDIFATSLSIEFHPRAEVPDGLYDRIVAAPEMIAAVSRAGVDCPKERVLILDGRGASDELLRMPPADENASGMLAGDNLIGELSLLVERAKSKSCSPSPVIVHIAPAW